MNGSSLLQKRFLGIYFRVTLFIWQRGTRWASSCLPVSWSLGLQGRMRNLRDVFSQPADTVHVQIHGNIGGIFSIIVKLSCNNMEWEDSFVKTSHCTSILQAVSPSFISVFRNISVKISFLPSPTLLTVVYWLKHCSARHRVVIVDKSTSMKWWMAWMGISCS